MNNWIETWTKWTGWLANGNFAKVTLSLSQRHRRFTLNRSDSTKNGHYVLTVELYQTSILRAIVPLWALRLSLRYAGMPLSASWKSVLRISVISLWTRNSTEMNKTINCSLVPCAIVNELRHEQSELVSNSLWSETTQHRRAEHRLHSSTSRAQAAQAHSTTSRAQVAQHHTAKQNTAEHSRAQSTPKRTKAHQSTAKHNSTIVNRAHQNTPQHNKPQQGQLWREWTPQN